MKTYEKIETVFNRDMEGTKKLIEDSYRSDAIRMLKDIFWDWTEKIDGTNIRVHWDGHTVEFGGRTDRANIPTDLMNKLVELFAGETNAQLFEQMFGEKDVILFGEGYGRKIQSVGSLYIPDGVDFILFDVCVNGSYLSRDAVDGIATSFGIKSVPIILRGDIGDAVAFVRTQPRSTIGQAPMEGLVGRPPVELQTARGERLIVKVKARDFC
jgi:hypothetical protein